MNGSFRQRTSRGTRRAALAVLAPSLMALSLSAAHAETFALAPDTQIVGTPGFYVAKAGDTLLDVARDNDLGYAQLMTSNRDMDPWRPGDGHAVFLPNVYLLPPGPRKGIVIDLAAQRLYYFPPGGKTVEAYPIGAGAEAGMTPRGTTKVTGKVVKPAWYVPKSIREEQPDLPAMVPAGPDNPLGEYAFRLGWPSYLIHGTNKPYGIGRNVSHGCIHLYPEDIEKVFREVPIGTPVRVIDDQMRLAWVDGELYLALAPTHAQIDQISLNLPMQPSVPQDLHARILAAAGDKADQIDWHSVDEIGQRRPGMPIAITLAPVDDSVSDEAELPRIDTSGAVASSAPAPNTVPDNAPQDVPAPTANAAP
jgi:L,D-transpeptidase ErfK/SrfK